MICLPLPIDARCSTSGMWSSIRNRLVLYGTRPAVDTRPARRMLRDLLPVFPRFPAFFRFRFILPRRRFRCPCRPGCTAAFTLLAIPLPSAGVTSALSPVAVSIEDCAEAECSVKIHFMNPSLFIHYALILRALSIVLSFMNSSTYVSHQ